MSILRALIRRIKSFFKPTPTINDMVIKGIEETTHITSDMLDDPFKEDPFISREEWENRDKYPSKWHPSWGVTHPDWLKIHDSHQKKVEERLQDMGYSLDDLDASNPFTETFTDEDEDEDNG